MTTLGISCKDFKKKKPAEKAAAIFHAQDGAEGMEYYFLHGEKQKYMVVSVLCSEGGKAEVLAEILEKTESMAVLYACGVTAEFSTKQYTQPKQPDEQYVGEPDFHDVGLFLTFVKNPVYQLTSTPFGVLKNHMSEINRLEHARKEFKVKTLEEMYEVLECAAEIHGYETGNKDVGFFEAIDNKAHYDYMIKAAKMMAVCKENGVPLDKMIQLCQDIRS